jgi:phage terminase large subunit-like protein
MASVVEVKNDGADNIRPVKPNRQQSTSRIDGIQALVTALDGIVRASADQKIPTYFRLPR